MQIPHSAQWKSDKIVTEAQLPGANQRKPGTKREEKGSQASITGRTAAGANFRGGRRL